MPVPSRRARNCDNTARLESNSPRDRRTVSAIGAAGVHKLPVARCHLCGTCWHRATGTVSGTYAPSAERTRLKRCSASFATGATAGLSTRVNIAFGSAMETLTDPSAFS